MEKTGDTQKKDLRTCDGCKKKYIFEKMESTGGSEILCEKCMEEAKMEEAKKGELC